MIALHSQRLLSSAVVLQCNWLATVKLGWLSPVSLRSLIVDGLEVSRAHQALHIWLRVAPSGFRGAVVRWVRGVSATRAAPGLAR